jgi:hypothetical protein
MFIHFKVLPHMFTTWFANYHHETKKALSAQLKRLEILKARAVGPKWL